MLQGGSVACAMTQQPLVNHQPAGFIYLYALHRISGCRKRFLRQPAALGGGRRRGRPLLQGAFLDGDLLFGYFQLPLRLQSALAAAAGSGRAAVLSHLGMLAANLAFL